MAKLPLDWTPTPAFTRISDHHAGEQLHDLEISCQNAADPENFLEELPYGLGDHASRWLVVYCGYCVTFYQRHMAISMSRVSGSSLWYLFRDGTAIALDAAGRPMPGEPDFPSYVYGKEPL